MDTGDNGMFTIRRIMLLCLKLTAILIFLFFGVIYYLGKYDCHTSAEDVARLKQLSELYPRYYFEFDCEFYLIVKSLEPITEKSDQEVVDIYNKFFEDDNGKLKRKTSFVYLNLYDSNGCFQYQLIHDWRENAYVKQNQEFY